MRNIITPSKAAQAQSAWSVEVIHNTPLEHVRCSNHKSKNLVGLCACPEAGLPSKANAITVVDADVAEGCVHVAICERIPRKSLADSIAQ